MSIIAVIGLGNMGGPMAANLLAAGHAVRGFDPVPAALAAAVGAGATGCASAAEAVRGAEVVLTMLPSGALVGQVYDDVLAESAEGTLYIDSSTISVDDARATGERARAAGMAHVDAPVSGGVKGATAGTLAFMVGGSAEEFERARPTLAPMAGKIIHCGIPGSGQAAKVCNNMILAVQQIVVGEAFLLAAKLGLSDQALYDVVTGATGNCWALEVNCPVPGPAPASPANNDFVPGFATALMRKDLGLAMDAVRSTGATAPMGSAAAAMYESFAEENGAKDFSAIIERLRT